MANDFTLPKDKPRDAIVQKIVTFLSALPACKAWSVKVCEFRKERSDEQNNALYGVAYKALGEFTGYTAPELHEVMLRAYFGEVEKEVIGTTVVRPRRTTTTDEHGHKSKLSAVEFAGFYNFIQQKGAEIGCYVPSPDPLHFMSADERAA